jgi:hypothetical protein
LTSTTTEPFACEVEGCGRTFKSKQGLGRHLTDGHGLEPASKKSRAAASVIDPDTYEGQVKMQLLALAEPLKAQVADIDTKIEAAMTTLRDLRKAKSDVMAVLGKLVPEEKNTTNGRAGSAAAYAAANLLRKTDRVQELLTENPKMFPEGFTPNLLAAELTTKVHGGLSNASAQKVIETLHDRGIVRADKVTRGGGMNYMLISKKGE